MGWCLLLRILFIRRMTNSSVYEGGRTIYMECRGQMFILIKGIRILTSNVGALLLKLYQGIDLIH